MVAFLERNGIELTATDRQALWFMLGLAAGDVIEDEVAGWIDAHSRAL